MNTDIRNIISTLSDGELSAISNSFTNNINNDSIKEQLLSKSNLNKLDFTRKELSDSLINELTNRLLSRNIELGKKNRVVTFLKRLFKFRFSYKKDKIE
jgi:hypothetical protein